VMVANLISHLTWLHCLVPGVCAVLVLFSGRLMSLFVPRQ